MRKEEQWRAEGMAFCVRFLEAHDNDVEALKAEINRRGIRRIPLAIGRAEEIEFCKRVRATLMETVLLMTLAVLHDTFDFGKKRCRRFQEAFDYAAGLLADDCINWSEISQGVREQLGMDVVLHWYAGTPPEGHV